MENFEDFLSYLKSLNIIDSITYGWTKTCQSKETVFTTIFDYIEKNKLFGLDIFCKYLEKHEPQMLTLLFLNKAQSSKFAFSRFHHNASDVLLLPYLNVSCCKESDHVIQRSTTPQCCYSNNVLNFNHNNVRYTEALTRTNPNDYGCNDIFHESTHRQPADFRNFYSYLNYSIPNEGKIQDLYDIDSNFTQKIEPLFQNTPLLINNSESFDFFPSSSFTSNKNHLMSESVKGGNFTPSRSLIENDNNKLDISDALKYRINDFTTCNTNNNSSNDLLIDTYTRRYVHLIPNTLATSNQTPHTIPSLDYGLNISHVSNNNEYSATNFYSSQDHLMHFPRLMLEPPIHQAGCEQNKSDDTVTTSTIFATEYNGSMRDGVVGLVAAPFSTCCSVYEVDFLSGGGITTTVSGLFLNTDGVPLFSSLSSSSYSSGFYQCSSTASSSHSHLISLVQKPNNPVATRGVDHPHSMNNNNTFECPTMSSAKVSSYNTHFAPFQNVTELPYPYVPGESNLLNNSSHAPIFVPYHSKEKYISLSSGSSELLSKMYDTALEKYERIKRDHETLRKKYTELSTSYDTTLLRIENESARIKNNLDIALNEKSHLLRENFAIKQHVTVLNHKYESYCTELKNMKEQLNKVAQQRDEAIKEMNHALALHIKSAKDSEKKVYERNAAVQEYTLIMAERDTVHREIDKLQDELNTANAKYNELLKSFQDVNLELTNYKNKHEEYVAERHTLINGMENWKNKYNDYILKNKCLDVQNNEIINMNSKIVQDSKQTYRNGNNKDSIKPDRGSILNRDTLSVDKLEGETFETKENVELVNKSFYDNLVYERDYYKNAFMKLRNEVRLPFMRDDWKSSIPNTVDDDDNKLFWQYEIIQYIFDKKIDPEDIGIEFKHHNSYDNEYQLLINKVSSASIFFGRVKAFDIVLKINDHVINRENGEQINQFISNIFQQSAQNSVFIWLKRKLDEQNIKETFLYTVSYMRDTKSVGIDFCSGIFIKHIEPSSIFCSRDTFIRVGDRIVSLTKNNTSVKSENKLGSSAQRYFMTVAKTNLPTLFKSKLTTLKCVPNTPKPQMNTEYIDYTIPLSCDESYKTSSYHPSLFNSSFDMEEMNSSFELHSNKPKESKYIRITNKLDQYLEKFNKKLHKKVSGSVSRYFTTSLDSASQKRHDLHNLTKDEKETIETLDNVLDFANSDISKEKCPQRYNHNKAFSWPKTKSCNQLVINSNRLKPLKTMISPASKSNMRFKSLQDKYGSSFKCTTHYHLQLFGQSWKPSSLKHTINSLKFSSTNQYPQASSSYNCKIPNKFLTFGSACKELGLKRKDVKERRSILGWWTPSSIKSSDINNESKISNNQNAINVNGESFLDLDNSENLTHGSESKSHTKHVYSTVFGNIKSSTFKTKLMSNKSKTINAISLWKTIDKVEYVKKPKSNRYMKYNPITLVKQEEVRSVVINKSTEPLGIQIECVPCENSEDKNGGIFISHVDENSLAQLAGLRIGDQLLEICGINLRNVSYSLAANVLRNCGDCITVLTQYNPNYIPKQYEYQKRHSLNISALSNDLSSIDSTNFNVTNQNGQSWVSPYYLYRKTNNMSVNGGDPSHNIQDPLGNYKAMITKNSRDTRNSIMNVSSLWETQSSHTKLVHLNNTNYLQPSYLVKDNIEIYQHNFMQLGLHVYGGNAKGLYIKNVYNNDNHGSNCEELCDQILEINNMSVKNFTLERCVMELGRYRYVSLLMQNKINPLIENTVENGDKFFIKVMFESIDAKSFMGSTPFEFCKGDVFLVNNTMPHGKLGYWNAWKLDERGKKITYEYIPSDFILMVWSVSAQFVSKDNDPTIKLCDYRKKVRPPLHFDDTISRKNSSNSRPNSTIYQTAKGLNSSSVFTMPRRYSIENMLEQEVDKSKDSQMCSNSANTTVNHRFRSQTFGKKLGLSFNIQKLLSVYEPLSENKQLLTNKSNDGQYQYTYLKKIEIYYQRPIILCGPLHKKIMDQLCELWPYKFIHFDGELMKCSPKMMAQGLQDNIYIDYKKCGTFFEYISLDHVKTLKNQKTAHTLLDISVEAIEKLCEVDIFPICVLIKFKNAKQWKDYTSIINRQYNFTETMIEYKNSKQIVHFLNKSSNPLLHSLVQTYIPSNMNLSSICEDLLHIIEQEQQKCIWHEVQRPFNYPNN